MAQSRKKPKVVRPAPIKVQVKFLADCDPEDGRPVFKAGSVHELAAPSAQHWIKRGKAVRYVESKVEEAPEPKEAPKTRRGSKKKSREWPEPEATFEEKLEAEGENGPVTGHFA